MEGVAVFERNGEKLTSAVGGVGLLQGMVDGIEEPLLLFVGVGAASRHERLLELEPLRHDVVDVRLLLYLHDEVRTHVERIANRPTSLLQTFANAVE